MVHSVTSRIDYLVLCLPLLTLHKFRVQICKKKLKKSADLLTVFADGRDAIAYTNINSLLYFQRRWLCQ